MNIYEQELIEKEAIKKTAYNELFHASGGVCPQTVLWEFGSLSPARTFVNPRLREAAATLAAMLWQVHIGKIE